MARSAFVLLLLSRAFSPGLAGAPHHGLVALETVQPPCLPEVRYATRHNFTGEILYPLPRLFLHRDAARALSRVQRDLQKRGLALKVWDDYRALSVQQKIWNLIRDERYVANPAKNQGRQTRGATVNSCRIPCSATASSVSRPKAGILTSKGGKNIPR